MNEKYVSPEEYDLRSNIIKCSRNLGIFIGGVSAVGGAYYENLASLGVGAGIAVLSFFGGNYINKINGEKKEKSIKNLESSFERGNIE